MSTITEKLYSIKNSKLSIRDAIKAKGGAISNDTPLKDYAASIESIVTPEKPESGVRFYDYEGTLLHSYTVDEALALESLPTGPDRSQNTACNEDIIPLTFDGWNWTLADIQTYLTNHIEGFVEAGANYHTTDNKIHIIFDQKENKDNSDGVWFSLSTASGTVDWGDGNTENITASGMYHTYDVAGIYHCIIDSSSTYVRCGGDDIKFSIKVKEVYLSSNITSIGNSAFYYCYSLQSINIPDSLTSISRDAFYNCYALQSITIPDGVTSIGEFAFQSCYSLQSITIPDSVTSIGQYAISYCRSLQSVTISSGVTSIGDSNFYNCSLLQSINIPDGVTSIGSNAFNNCASLQSITIPDSVTSIGSYAFSGCSSLQSVNIPDSVTSIGNSAFSSCSLLQSVSIPNSVTSIGDSAFSSCSLLQSVNIPDSVTSIGSQAFFYCYSLQSINIPDSVTSIGTQTFSACYSLQSITIPDGVTSIGNFAFSDCRSLHTVFLKPTTPPALSNSNAFNTSYQKKFVVPVGTLADYQAATNWSTFADLIVGDTITECTSLTITADDVIGNSTSTTVHYTAICNGTNIKGETVTGFEITRDDTVTIEQNTSTTESVTRTITYTFYGQTATTTITQGAYLPPVFDTELSGFTSYGWEKIDSPNSGYDCYKSTNQGKNSTQAVMKITAKYAGDFTIYIRSYAESSSDYTIASTVNASSYPTSSSSNTQSHTKNTQNSGISLSDYTAVTYTGLSVGDYIYIVYRKDGSSASGDDTGYVLLPYKTE